MRSGVDLEGGSPDAGAGSGPPPAGGPADGRGQPPHVTLLALLDRAHAEHPLPHGLRRMAETFAYQALALLFPHFAPAHSGAADLERDLNALGELLEQALAVPATTVEPTARASAVEHLISRLGPLREALLLDAQAIYDGDPAAESVDEVILAYPGFLAIAIYRLAHELHGRVSVFPRLLSEVAHRATGIDIHPGARIGRSFAIDHGTGVVVGETAELGDHVRLYQGVTLGAVHVNKRLEHVKRHPTIGNDVVIYANATILGGGTTIGRGSRIGGNVWLTRSVPPVLGRDADGTSGTQRRGQPRRRSHGIQHLTTTALTVPTTGDTMKYANVLETIGNTPHIRINRLFDPRVEVWMKAERTNPGGSIKDRIGLSMIEDAERRGLIGPDSLIVEPTSGNTGVGLAIVAAVRGYRLLLVMPESMSIERRRLFAVYGAELELTPRELGMKGAIDRAAAIAAETPGSGCPAIREPRPMSKSIGNGPRPRSSKISPTASTT